MQFYSNCTASVSIKELIWPNFICDFLKFQLIFAFFFQIRMKVPLLCTEASPRYFSIHVFPLTSPTPFASKSGITDKLSAATAAGLNLYFLVFFPLWPYAETWFALEICLVEQSDACILSWRLEILPPANCCGINTPAPFKSWFN